MNWRELPAYPLADEVMAVRPRPLPSNPVERPYPSKEIYLETLYLLLRHEVTEPLRNAIQEYRKNPRISNTPHTRIYTKVQVRGYYFEWAGVSCVVEVSNPILETDQSERLIPGTLLAFSSDGFRSECFLATVKTTLVDTNPTLTAGGTKTSRVVGIEWAQYDHKLTTSSRNMVMMECTTSYFESIRHVLISLQQAARTETRFDEYLIKGSHAEKRINTPACAPQEQFVASSILDPTQLRGFERMTTLELALVQGPPGTGKTFTSITALRSLVQNVSAPSLGVERGPKPLVIVAAQTNHAVDQLLRICLENKIGKIARLGRSDVNEIIPRLVNKICKRSNIKQKPTEAEKAKHETILHLKELLTQMVSSAHRVSADGLYYKKLISLQQYESLHSEDDWDTVPDDSDAISMWLGNTGADPSYSCHALQDLSLSFSRLEMESLSDEQESHTGGEFVRLSIGNNLDSVPSSSGDNSQTWRHHAEHLLATTPDLYDINPSFRAVIYKYWQESLYRNARNEFRSKLLEHEQHAAKARIQRWSHQANVLLGEGVQIVGCTTTGLTKYWGLLEALKPRVLMIEEAGETREANVTSALFSTLEQLILVGDHQQLAPHVNMRWLALPPYNLSVSLLERLINMGLPYTMLQVQRRMRPDIRKVVNALYPRLTDHGSVNHLAPVPGMEQNVWWFTHAWPESKHLVSFCNMTEAEMIIGFVRFLVERGTDPSGITIISYYAGQVQLIHRKLLSEVHLKQSHPTAEWSVVTVDGYQGEENDIVILSSVRSPRNPGEPANAGFVELENRATVALSRARRGLYIFGNLENLLDGGARSTQTWKKVSNVFTANRWLDSALPVQCRAHKRRIQIKDPCEWPCVLAGGCGPACDQGSSGMEAKLLSGGISQEEIEPPGLLSQSPSGRKNELPSLPSRSPSEGQKEPRVRPIELSDLIQTSDSLMERGYFQSGGICDTQAVPEAPSKQSDIQNSCGILIDIPTDTPDRGDVFELMKHGMSQFDLLD